jgi:hypothetical protein
LTAAAGELPDDDISSSRVGQNDRKQACEQSGGWIHLWGRHRDIAPSSGKE